MTNKEIISKGIYDQTMIAWAAGLFEGEGSFCFNYGKPKAIQIASTDKDVLEKVVQIFGGKVYTLSRDKMKSHWKTEYVWKLPTSHTLDFFSKVEPFLGERRLERGREYIRLFTEIQERREQKSKDTLERYAKIFELREQGLTHQKISEEVGLDRSHVSKILRNGEST